MSRLMKKRTIRYKITQVMMTVVYLFVTFTIPLNHTCGLHETCSKYHFDNPDHYCGIDIHTDVQPEVDLKQDNCKAEILSHSNPCIACLYSITSKSTQVNTGRALINIKVPISFQTLPTLGIVRQSEWLSSVSLRAPPIINS